MGRILMRCNLSEEEQKTALEEFDDYLEEFEENEASFVMPNYLFYYPDNHGRTRECTCTHVRCGRFTMEKKYEPEFFRHQHGENIHCPVCGESVRLIAAGRMRTFESLNRQWTRITVFRTGESGALLALSGWVRRQYSWNELRPPIEFEIKCKTWLKPGKRMQWKTWAVGYGCGYWEYKMLPNSRVEEPFQPYMYSSEGDSYIIGTEQIGESSLKYSQLMDWYWQASTVDLSICEESARHVVQYLSAYTAYPTLEMAVKLDMEQAATDLVIRGIKNSRIINWKATNIQQFLGLNKADTKIFLRANGNLKLLKAYKLARRNEITGNISEYIGLLNDAGGINHAELLTDLAIRCRCSFRQAVNYINKFQETGSHGFVLTLWRDYLNMAETLEYDLTRKDVFMPKDLRDRHDAAAETITYQRKMIEEKKYEEFNRRLRKMYEFEYGGLCIVCPGSVTDIVTEGKVLKHCVGGYAARHFNGKLEILFLRNSRKKHKPFITIEMIHRDTFRDKARIKQIHGYKNETYGQEGKRPVKPEVRYAWFLKVWKKWLEAGSRRDKHGRPIIPEEKEKTA